MTSDELDAIEKRADFHHHVASETVIKMIRDMRKQNEYKLRAEKAEAQLRAAREGKLGFIHTEESLGLPDSFGLWILGRLHLESFETKGQAHADAAERGLTLLEEGNNG